MQHVVIGAGPSGVIAAETLRKLQPAASVTLLGDEPEPPYSRMAIPYFLTKQIAEQGTHLRKTSDHFAQRDIKIMQTRVASLDRVAQQLTLAGGE